ncbi:MAG: acyclic terpene utilization AtuA family protein [Betaproteobacteria bacterium]
MEEVRILSPTAILGYGFPLSSFDAGLAQEPDLIAVDAGSTDPGPYYLGAGVSFTDRQAVKRDLVAMLRAGVERGIPVIVGSAGGSGARPHLDWNRRIIEEIAAEEGLHFRMGVIPADIDRDWLLRQLEARRVRPCGPAPDLTPEAVQASTYLVAQMGVEPFLAALDAGAQVILAGRSYDPACFAAAAIQAGYDWGLALHLGKILECAAIAATPGSGSDCMFGWLRRDHFLIEPTNPSRRCTTTSVAAHTLYEKSDPYHLPGPGGMIDLTGCEFTQITERRVRVAGSRFVRPEKYLLKVEGARRVGFRTVSLAGARDPVFLARLEEIVAGVRARVADNFADLPESSYRLLVRVYGKDGVMADLEPASRLTSHEVGLVIEAVAETQELANTICAFARSTMLHYGYEGRLSTAGNLAFPYSPSDFKAGEVYEFSVYHLVEMDDPARLFPVEIVEV